MPVPETRIPLTQLIASHPGWVSLSIFATLIGLVVFFIDLGYRASIDDLHRKIRDKESEISAMAEAKDQLMKRLSALTADSISGVKAGGVDASSPANKAYPATSLRLTRSKTVFFWDDQCKITLLYGYSAISNAQFDGYLGDQPFRWDLYTDRREQIVFLGSQYYLEVLEVQYDSALLKIIPKRSS